MMCVKGGITVQIVHGPTIITTMMCVKGGILHIITTIITNTTTTTTTSTDYVFAFIFTFIQEGFRYGS